jgi:hypothetical protein
VTRAERKPNETAAKIRSAALTCTQSRPRRGATMARISYHSTNAPRRYAQDQAELDLFLDRAEAGVLYANRASGATTGAWPGIQSFCGWKSSGVTSKGGLGPYYQPQFMREQSRTVWTGG